MLRGLPEGVERFDAPTVGRRAWPESMEPSPDGAYMYVSDLPKIEEAVAERLRKAVLERAGGNLHRAVRELFSEAEAAHDK